MGRGATGTVYLARDPSGRPVCPEAPVRRACRRRPLPAALPARVRACRRASGIRTSCPCLPRASRMGPLPGDELHRRRGPARAAVGGGAAGPRPRDADRRPGRRGAGRRPRPRAGAPRRQANILVERDGECAYLCDFGLARHATSPDSLTGQRAFVGTIAYVAPDQRDRLAGQQRGLWAQRTPDPDQAPARPPRAVGVLPRGTPGPRSPARVTCKRSANGLTIRVASRSEDTSLREIVGDRLRIGFVRPPSAEGDAQIRIGFGRR